MTIAINCGHATEKFGFEAVGIIKKSKPLSETSSEWKNNSFTQAAITADEMLHGGN